MVTLSFFRHEDTKEFSPGQVIFNAGDDGNAMYVVVEGEIEIRIGSVIAEVVLPGGIFGEMALIDQKQRSAMAVARSAAKLVVLDRRRFQFMVGQTPYFALEVMSIMADRLRRANERLNSTT